MATFSAVILKGKVHVKQDNSSNIKIRIIHKRQIEYLSTDLFVHHKKFTNGQAKGDNAAYINGRIRDELNKYEKLYLKMGSLPERLTVKELKHLLTNGSLDEEIDFLKFAEAYGKKLIEEGKTSSGKIVNTFVLKLRGFRSTLTFNQIDVAFLKSFESYLKRHGVGNAINNYMRYFRLIFNQGRDHFNDEDRGIIIIPHYPFRKYKIGKYESKTQDHCLTIEEVRMFINYKPDRERMQMAKDMFLLMLYMIGINTKDLYNLSRQDRKGRVTYFRAKTNRKYSIFIEPEALEIISRYKGDKTLVNIAERYANYRDWQKYVNLELKAICKNINAQLKKENSQVSFPSDVSTNWARHTWATIARNDCRINKDDVALCLGHEDTDNRVTDMYIRYDHSIVDESNRKVIDKVLGIVKDKTHSIGQDISVAS